MDNNEPNKRLFVGGLAWATTDVSLKAHFEQCGMVIDAKVMKDRETDRSRGFGFVEFETQEEATQAVETLNGTQLDGREIKVNYAQARVQQPGGGNFRRN